MADKFIWQIPSTTVLNSADKLFSVKGTTEYLITVSDFVTSLSLPTQSDYEKLAKLNINGDGNSFLANDGNYKILTDLFDTTQFEKNETSARIELIGWHEHDNKTDILDKFSLNIDGDLLFDGDFVGNTPDTMLKSVYDTNDSGIVDNAEKVNGFTVEINVPANAVFTDTVTEVDDVLNSTSTTNALSANQGKIVNDKVVNIENGITKTNAQKIQDINVSTTTPTSNQVLLYNGTNLQYEPTTINALNLDNLIQDNGITITKDVENNTATFKLNIPNWTAETDYYVGNYVLNENKIYKCKTLHTSGLTFDETNWDMIGGSDGTKIADWISGTEYFLKDLVIYSNSIWQCTTANTDTVWTESNWNCVSTGADGINAYVYIKYSAIQPTQDSDITDTPSNWIGFYSGSSETAPTTYTSYTWYKFKGETGLTGNDGLNGSIWYYGTAITGNSTTPTVYSTGITLATTRDYYINISTNYIYKCMLSGDDTVAEWIYIGQFDGLTLNDTSISSVTTYSSTKIESRLSEKQDKITISSTLTLTVAGWNSGTKTQKVLISLNTNNVNSIIYDLSSLDMIISSGVNPSLEETTGITFKCTTIPTSDITFKVKVAVII